MNNSKITYNNKDVKRNGKQNFIPEKAKHVSVRKIDIDGNLYVPGVDVAKALGYEDPSEIAKLFHQCGKLT